MRGAGYDSSFIPTDKLDSPTHSRFPIPTYTLPVWHITCSPDPSVNRKIFPFYDFPEDTQHPRLNPEPAKCGPFRLSRRSVYGRLGGRHEDWVLFESLLCRGLCVVNGKGKGDGFGFRRD